MTQPLILGGAGFIGSNLARRLVDRGVRPRILTRPSAAVANLKDILDRIDLVYGDFMDDVAVRQAARGVDVVYHLVSTTFPSMTVESSVYDLLSNLLPTIRLVEICAAGGVKKIVYASSGGTVYGEPRELPIREDHPLTPLSAYGQSKLTIENYLRFYQRSIPMDVDILRISNPFGERQNPFGVQGIVAVAMGCARDDRVLKICGRGETVRDYIYIGDVVDALLCVAEREGSSLVNISTGKGMSVLDVVRAVETLVGRPLRKEFVAPRAGDVSVNILSNQRARETYGWTPRTPLDEALRRTWAWIQGGDRP